MIIIISNINNTNDDILIYNCLFSTNNISKLMRPIGAGIGAPLTLNKKTTTNSPTVAACSRTIQIHGNHVVHKINCLAQIDHPKLGK